MDALIWLKSMVDKAKAAWAAVSPWVKKLGPNGAWFLAGFATAKLISCVLG